MLPSRAYFYLVLTALLMHSVARAQEELPVLWGASLDDEKGSDIVSVFGHGEASFLVLRDTRRKRDGFILERISTDSLERIKSVKILFPEVAKNTVPTLIYPVSFADRSFLITEAREPNSPEVKIYAFEVYEDLSLNKNPAVIGAGNAAAWRKDKGFSIFLNEEKTLASVIIPQEIDSEKNEKFKLLLLDSKFNTIRSKNLEIPYASGNFGYADALVDSSRSIYILASMEREDIENPRDDRNLGKDFSLFRYTWETEQLTEKSLSIGTKWLYDVRLLLNKSGNLQAAGYFSNMIDLIMAGTFSLEIDRKTGEIENQGITTFSREFRENFRPGSQRSSVTELGKFNLDFVHPFPGKIVHLLSEKNFVETSTVFNPATGTYSVISIYSYNEILVSGITPSSKVAYNLVIPKFQSSNRSRSSYTSFTSFNTQNTSVLLYNDNKRNLELPLTSDDGYRQLNSANNTAITVVLIDVKGNASKRVVAPPEGEDGDLILDPRFVYRYGNKAVFITTNSYRTRYFKILAD
ncbi:MAG TPA: hypothetical protein VJ911_01110 [Cryomorphaceae bacterium]|nr:hypothetical protein [Cryomorphaceae bacterium]